MLAPSAIEAHDLGDLAAQQVILRLCPPVISAAVLTKVRAVDQD